MRTNTAPFKIAEHLNRMQPFTVWRGKEVWHFDATEEAASKYIAQQLARETERRA